MSKSTLPSRVVALATASALALATAPAAWSAPPPIPPRMDPPTRVARLARTTGTVSFHSADADQWSPATVNGPIISGDALWTEPGARADVQLSTNRMAMAPSTELDVTVLDDQSLATSEPQGETYLNLRQVPQGNHYTVQTPRGAVEMAVAGRYGVIAGDADHPTVVTVIDGAAVITGPNLSLQLGPRQTATLTGANPVQGSVGPMAQDAFLTTVLAEEKPAPRSRVAIPPVVQQMTGAEDLDEQGQWQDTPQYGTVWYPPVDAGWIPYRQGHWSYIAPWGWTWVDDAAWGFAPFHYGRWAQVDHRWGWIPVTPGAEATAPVYAPALVSFLAVGAVAGALAGRSVGWVPLGPREPYYPPYRADLGYVRSINASSIQNVNQTITTANVVNRTTVMNNFVNRGAATLVPATAMIGSSPIAAAARPLPAAQFANSRAQAGSPVPPGPATAGVTPAVARQFNFIPTARPAQAVPGPAIGRTAPHPIAAASAPAAGPPPAAPPGAAGEPERRGPEGAGVPGSVPPPGATVPRPAAPIGAPAAPAVEAGPRPPQPGARPQVNVPPAGARPGVPQPSRPPIQAHAPAPAFHPQPPARPPEARPAPPRPVALPRTFVPAPRPAPSPRPAPPPRPAEPARPAAPPHPASAPARPHPPEEKRP